VKAEVLTIQEHLNLPRCSRLSTGAHMCKK